MTKEPFRTGELAKLFLQDLKIKGRPEGADEVDALALAGVILHVVAEFNYRLGNGETAWAIKESIVKRNGGFVP